MGDGSEIAVRSTRSRRRLTVALLLLVALVAASWTQVDPIDPRVPPAIAVEDVSIIAHAGAQGHAPPNTMAAFEAALDLAPTSSRWICS